MCSAAMRELLRIIKDQVGTEQKVNNLEKSDCENVAAEKTDEIHRR